MQRTVPTQGTDITIDGGNVTVTDGDVTVQKRLDHPAIDIVVDGDEVVVSTESDRRDHQAIVGTYASHVQNLVDGVTHGFEYTMKGFYAHFPMDMSVNGDTFVIKNFIGERADRRIDIPDGVDIEIDDEDVVLTGPNKDAVAQTAANIEQACYKGNRDPRKFQDGIYITGKKVSER